MIFALISFYSALIGLGFLFFAKKREQNGAPTAVLRKLNQIFEPRLEILSTKIASFYQAHINMMRVKLIIASLSVAVESIGRNIKTETQRFYFALTHKVRENKNSGQKMAVSFFLKDIADYKHHLTEGR